MAYNSTVSNSEMHLKSLKLRASRVMNDIANMRLLFILLLYLLHESEAEALAAKYLQRQSVSSSC
jgi:hypothetical protein